MGAVIGHDRLRLAERQGAPSHVKHPVPYPTDAELHRLEFQTDIGRATALVDQIYTEIKSA